MPVPIQWQGVYPALTTKFTPNDTLDFPTTALNIRAQLEAGAHGLILGGSLGEASTLSNGEKLDLLRFTLDEVAGRVPVLMNIAEGATREAVALAKAGQEAGADGFMLLPPMRYKSDDRETVAFFKAVADVSEVPILLYNNPVDYKIEITLDMFEALLEVSNIQAVKESTRDVTNVTRLRNRFGDRLKILCGVDTLAMEELLMGADGWVAGLVCAFPRETVAIYRLVKAGRLAEARAVYRWFMPLLELDIHPKLVQYIKLAEQFCGIGTEHVRAPRLPLEGQERVRVEGIIRVGMANRPLLPDVEDI
jgi:1-pyrroline-4-hydroxy-2-carboxylate deaminase